MNPPFVRSLNLSQTGLPVHEHRWNPFSIPRLCIRSTLSQDQYNQVVSSKYEPTRQVTHALPPSNTHFRLAFPQHDVQSRQKGRRKPPRGKAAEAYFPAKALREGSLTPCNWSRLSRGPKQPRWTPGHHLGVGLLGMNLGIPLKETRTDGL